MRYFALFLMLFSLGMFAMGCAKEEPAPVTPPVTEPEPEPDTEPETDPETDPEPDALPPE